MIVFAILLSLPFAKFLIAWIMCARFEPLTEEQYQKLCQDISDKEKTENMDGVLFDVVITQYEGMKFYQSMCVKNGKVVALVLAKDFQQNKKEYREWIERCVTGSKYKYTVTLCSEIGEYGKKVHTISTPNDKTAMIDRHIREKILTTCV